MKKLYFLTLVTVLAITVSNAQVRISKDGAPPDPSAMLDVRDPNMGMLIPRVALTGTNDITTIPSPATSLLVYNTATTAGAGTAVSPGFYYWDGSKWSRFTTNPAPDVPEVVNMRGLFSAATTYVQNDLVSTGTNRDVFYYSLTSSNVGHDPASSPGFWQAVEVEQLKQIHKTLTLSSSGFASLMSLSLTGTNTAGGRIQYTIRATDGGSQIATEEGVLQYLATPNSITCNVQTTDKLHLGTVGSGCTPGFFNPASQPGVSVFDNVTFSSPAAVATHDVYFRIYPAGGQLLSGVYSKVRLRIEP